MGLVPSLIFLNDFLFGFSNILMKLERKFSDEPESSLLVTNLATELRNQAKLTFICIFNEFSDGEYHSLTFPSQELQERQRF